MAGRTTTPRGRSESGGGLSPSEALADNCDARAAAVPGRSELFLRVVGPKPNGYLWPNLVRFTTSTVEVWIEQLSTGELRYYRLPGASPGSSDLSGLFDRTAFEAI